MREEKPVTMVMGTMLSLLQYRNRDSLFVQKLSCLPFVCLLFTVSVLQFVLRCLRHIFNGTYPRDDILCDTFMT